MPHVSPFPRCLTLTLGVLSLIGCSDVSIQSSRSLQTNGYRFDFSGEQASHADTGEIADDASVIAVENQFGAVTVSVTEEAPRWEWSLTCWADSAATAKKYTASIKLQTDAKDGEYSWKLVLPTPPVDDLRGVKSDLALFVPAAVRVDLQNAHGDSKVEGVQGGTKARCRHGKLELLKLAGELDAETEHGELKASQIPGGVLTNSHGDISAVDVAGALKAATSHGDVSLERVEGSVQVTNEHGRVTSTDVAEGLHVRNEHGEVVATGVAGPIDASTTFAKLEVSKAGGDVLLRNEHGAVVVNGGGGKVDVATEHGAIEIESPADTLRCRNEHGRIRIVSTGPTFQLIDAETSFGDIDVHVPADAKIVIEAGTEHGKLDSDFPVLQLNSAVDNFAGLDESTPRMTLKNSHGDIRIKR